MFRDGLPGATRHPFEDVRFVPTDVFPVKVMAARDLSDRRQAHEHPPGSPDQTCDIMGREDTIPRGIRLIDPAGDRDSLSNDSAARIGATLSRICRHKRPSMWFRSFRVKLSRMAQ